MASQRQINANRNNAQKSTGPKTEEGKFISRWGALQHGLTATGTPLLPGENVEELLQLTAELEEHFAPVGPVEEQLVSYLTFQLWRLARVYRVETGIIGWYMRQGYGKDLRVARARSAGGSFGPTRPEDDPADASPPLEPDDEARFDQWAEEMLETRDQAVVGVAAAFIEDAGGANALTKLSRYETTLRRGVERTLSQLRALAEDKANSSA